MEGEPMPLPSIQGFIDPGRSVANSLPSLTGPTGTPELVSLHQSAPLNGLSNPFLLNVTGYTGNRARQSAYQMGENRPLARPMFLGYRDNKPLYGGARLFTLA